MEQSRQRNKNKNLERIILRIISLFQDKQDPPADGRDIEIGLLLTFRGWYSLHSVVWSWCDIV